MPYIDGKRVSNEEWTERYGSIKKLHTGPNGENPADGPDIDEEVGAPKPKAKSKRAGGNRSAKSAKATRAAIADALGVTDTSPQLEGIDVSGLDAPGADGKKEDE